MIASLHESRQLIESVLGAGASGYVVKSMADSDLVNALNTVVAGRVYVSPALARALPAHA